ncbi:HBR018Cp [Eremothecium sinecaudum]|uniref:Glutamate pyruvate transaminase n=1 Tax=Eremothecium sinecaudum TaxID=45286 RepID=A0A120K115_9SACH|nr:HBR018Cp [Eremothecium sinecaudum]AMD18919.1 HBR018Cp [Eremothecium sinecaudum]
MLRRNSGCPVTLNGLQSGCQLILRRISTNGLNVGFEPADSFTLDDLNENVLKAKYAVRGKIPMRAEELQEQLEEKPGSLPFKKIIGANIGNPQQLDQKPLTFFRQVLSLLQNPDLLGVPPKELSKYFKPDAIKRARVMLKEAGNSVGAYSASKGVLGFRQRVAEFITARDGAKNADPENVFLTAGASAAASRILSVFSKGPKTGTLIPIPQYPLYTATLSLNNARAIPYYLKEEQGWSTDPKEIERIVLESIRSDIKPTCMVIINPGNPTGAILSVEALEEIFVIAARYGIVVIADEVYQENVFEGAQFHSSRKVLLSLQKRYPGVFDNVQLASLNSTSKGLLGECGQRGGYMELIGFRDEILQVFVKLASISLCPVVTGQALVGLMSSPPNPGDESYQQHEQQRAAIHKQLEERADLLWRTFNELEGLECQKPQGAMYLFPKLILPSKAIDVALKQNMEPDEFYCKRLLERTGICTVPGSGFGQAAGTYHLRTTFLAPGTEWIESWRQFHKEFYDEYRD